MKRHNILPFVLLLSLIMCVCMYVPAHMGSFASAVPDVSVFLPLVMPVVVARVGYAQEVVEPSEELRLALVSLVSLLVKLCGECVAPFLSDVVNILQKTIVDPYPEVKKVRTYMHVHVISLHILF